MITGSVDGLRRLIQEPSVSGTYTNPILSEYLAWAGGDMYGAGYLIWSEKAAGLAGKFDYSADGESFHLQQLYDNAMSMQNFCLRMRGAKTNLLVKDPPEEDEDDESDVQS